MPSSTITLHCDLDLRLELVANEAGEPSLTLDFGHARIEAAGLGPVEDLIAGFGAREAARVSCRCDGFALAESPGEPGTTLVVYLDRGGEVWLTRPDYDRMAELVGERLGNIRMRTLFATLPLRLVGTGSDPAP